MKSVILGLLLITPVWAADDVLPRRPEFRQYEPMMNRSPFAVATAVEPASTPDFAKDLYVANAAKSPDGDFVTIASSTDRNFKKYLSNKEPVEGYSVTSIEWSDHVGATKVTITKDGKYATLTFNQALLAQPAAPIAGPQPALQLPTQAIPSAVAPGVQTPAFIRPAPIPSIPPVQPAPVPQPPLQGRKISRGLIQRSPPVPNLTPVPQDSEE